MLLGISTNVYAGEYNKNEQYAIEKISGEDFPVKIEQQYINQLKNYFYRSEVHLEKIDAEDFVTYLEDALVEKTQLDEQKSSFDEKSSVFQNFQKAAASIGLIFEYDSSVNDFYVIDNQGYIVIDTQKIIKNTDTESYESEIEQNESNIIESVFAIIVIVCILGILANIGRWNEKMKRRNEKYEEDDEDESELETARKKINWAGFVKFSTSNVKQILRYFYIPIIMGILAVGIGCLIINTQSDIINSVKASFVNTQPLYNKDKEGFVPVVIEQSKQENTIDLTKITWPKYGEQYGMLQCERLKIEAPVYMGDRGEFLNKGAGNYLGSFIPGQGGTILIGAHDTTYFEGLYYVEKGDSFTFTTEYGIYVYKVVDTKIADKDNYDKAYDLSSDKEQLVLYTCYPFGRLNGTKTERMFVYLDKISGPGIRY